MIRKEDAFLKELDRISDSVVEKGEVNYDVEKFKEKFFYQSSHSPDNINSMNLIEYGAYRDEIMERRRFGLKIKDKKTKADYKAVISTIGC